MSNTDVWKTATEVETCIQGMGNDLATLLEVRQIDKPLMIGVHTGGVWLAQCLHDQIALTDPLGQLDISFYRDDFTRIGMHPQVRPSRLPVPVDNRHIILVDDVLQTGRTIRAALNILFDYGRPASVLLATLAERDGRELPIEPNLVGLRARLEPGQQIKLTGPDPLQLVLGRIPPGRGGNNGPAAASS
ncbi:bifunctional pyr operon transcriptional regulator/uracil phosphoribosyltransferase PyrR [Candidatus Thiosymbion oneisti]|uniref:bifunctional pyr operon transcriptional regulator/uracil phosphoribosyltransferase PyrR n=1 Tax=Candidatus Thiosymbion oneisti TaxID=589554 RepID=UPI000B265DBB|nr:bifunctional pyr operon transcriptional regulator/uracil phosphoribosyltransferase PyrR [Candidatus Thiosymbion oneisti]